MVGQQLPLAKFKAGQVSSAVWENQIMSQGKVLKILKATIQRRYKDKNGQWQSTTSFNRNEISLAVHCLQQALTKIIEIQNAEDSINRSVEDVTGGGEQSSPFNGESGVIPPPR
jgi:hypothetical protein